MHREAVGASKACRARPDDGDALSCRRRAGERVLAALHQKVGRIALQLTDPDGLVLGEIADAGFLAQRLDRTDTRAHAAHDVGIEDRLAGAARIVGLDLADEERNVDVRRARLHAGRVETEIAAVGLHERLVARERRMQIGKIPGVVVGTERARRDVRLTLCEFDIDPPSIARASGALCEASTQKMNRVSKTVKFFINRSNFG